MSNKKKHFKIKEPKIEQAETIKFSFAYYDCNSRYCLSKWEQREISKALDKLGEVNRRTHSEMQRDKITFRFHPVDWEKTKEKNGFPNKEVNNYEPFQFALPGINNQKARVFGGYASYVFYIVWFDYNHVIQPVNKKHT